MPASVTTIHTNIEVVPRVGPNKDALNGINSIKKLVMDREVVGLVGALQYSDGSSSDFAYGFRNSSNMAGRLLKAAIRDLT